MRVMRRVVIALVSLVILPATVFAQATLSGFVKDTSGGVLPGVSVEASSPVLIEKVRTGISDSTGLYRIPDLPPGIYTVTFTLPGFATVSREGVEVAGGGVTTINADMRVGALTETITVTGESPVVDTQTSTRRQMVLSSARWSRRFPRREATATSSRRYPAFKQPGLTSAPACRRTSSPRVADAATRARSRSTA